MYMCFQVLTSEKLEQLQMQLREEVEGPYRKVRHPDCTLVCAYGIVHELWFYGWLVSYWTTNHSNYYSNVIHILLTHFILE